MGSRAAGGRSTGSPSGQPDGSVPRPVSSSICSFAHGEISAVPPATSAVSRAHGTQRTSSTSSGFGRAVTSVIARNTGHISFSTMPLPITAR